MASSGEFSAATFLKSGHVSVAELEALRKEELKAIGDYLGMGDTMTGMLKAKIVQVLSDHLQLVEEEEREEEAMSLHSQVVLAKIAWEKEKLDRQEKKDEIEREYREKEIKRLEEKEERERQEREIEREYRENEIKRLEEKEERDRVAREKKEERDREAMEKKREREIKREEDKEERDRYARQLEIERGRKFELDKIQMEQDLYRSTQSGSEFGLMPGGGRVGGFDMAREIRLVPKFQ